jgi:hypothetical protein
MRYPPFFSQSQGRKQPMISQSAVAKKQRGFEHISLQVRIYLNIIPDDGLFHTCRRVCRLFALV